MGCFLNVVRAKSTGLMSQAMLAKAMLVQPQQQQQRAPLGTREVRIRQTLRHRQQVLVQRGPLGNGVQMRQTLRCHQQMQPQRAGPLGNGGSRVQMLPTRKNCVQVVCACGDAACVPPHTSPNPANPHQVWAPSSAFCGCNGTQALQAEMMPASRRDATCVRVRRLMSIRLQHPR